jgi:hypothetical protein
MRSTFSVDYPVDEFRSLHISPEFPILRADYPAVWVDFEPTGPLQPSGVDSTLYTGRTVNGNVSGYKIWRFEGNATYTVMALSSLERDRLADEIIRTIAFGGIDPTRSTFRRVIESNPWIATNINFDQIQQRGKQANAGTPWGTDEEFYEMTLSVQCIGEFASDPSTADIVILREIVFIPGVEHP